MIHLAVGIVKGKRPCAEGREVQGICAENRYLKERAQEDSKKLSKVVERLRGAEIDKQLLEMASPSYKDEIRMTMQRTELEKTQLGETLTEVRSQEQATRKKVQELEEERAALVKQVYN